MILYVSPTVTSKMARRLTEPFEVMRTLRKAQASNFNITRDMRGEARLVEHAFNVGPWVLPEAVQVISQQFELQDA